MNTIIAAIDFTSDYKSVLEQSIEYALKFKATLRLVHVMASLPSSAENWTPVAEYEKIIAAIKSDYLNRLEALASTSRDRGVETDHRLLHGYPSVAILDAATEVSASLIVIGHRHHGILHELFGSSVSRGVLKRSRIPVLVLPDPQTVDGFVPLPEDKEPIPEPFRFLGQT
ncbi:MAG TPA: universal stress protein [Opitutaceae bacterium]